MHVVFVCMYSARCAKGEFVDVCCVCLQCVHVYSVHMPRAALKGECAQVFSLFCMDIQYLVYSFCTVYSVCIL